MTEDNVSPASELEEQPTADATKSDHVVRKSSASVKSRKVASVKVSRSAVRGKRAPLRSIGGLVAVGGLLAALVVPAAMSSTEPAAADAPRTLQQEAVDSAQGLTVSDTVVSAELDRDSYAATTPEEIETKKAEEAAIARAKADAEAAAYTQSIVNLNLVSSGSGAVRWPIEVITYVGDGFMSRGGAHDGVDLLSPGGTPIYAAADGVVVVSSENYYGYGVAVVIDHVIGGQSVQTLYAHMTYGTRTVSEGQTVSAGQLIGLVGSTGYSTANHLHFEVTINGSLVDPYAWLLANAG